MEHQNKKPEAGNDQINNQNMKEVGSNLTGTARPALPDEKEFIAHHMNKNAQHSKIQNTDALLGNIESDNEKSKD